MRDFRDAKAMAQSLRRALTDTSVTVTHSQSLELIARAFGFDNWNILAAKIEAEKPTTRPEPATSEAPKTLYCSFCGKSQHDVRNLIAGPDTFICDECVGLCDNIIFDGALKREISEAKAQWPDADPSLVAADVLKAYSDERLQTYKRSNGDWLEHIEWSLRQITAALDGGARTPWRPDELARQRGWTRDPLAGKSRNEILALRDHWHALREQVGERAVLVSQVLADRGVGQDPNASA